jgi:hypothetical protein
MPRSVKVPVKVPLSTVGDRAFHKTTGKDLSRLQKAYRLLIIDANCTFTAIPRQAMSLRGAIDTKDER